MSRIFSGYCLIICLLLAASLWTGHTKIDKPANNLEHFSSGLITCICGVGLHALVIVYFIGTGRTIKAAIQEITLPPEFLERSNLWYNTKGYAWAGMSCVFLVTTLVLGGALDSGRTSVHYFHLGFAYFTIFFNCITFRYEFRSIVANGKLLHDVDRYVESHHLSIERTPTPPIKTNIPDPPAPFMLAQKLVFYGITLLFPYVFLKNGWGWDNLPFWPFLSLCLILCIPGVILKIVYRPSTWTKVGIPLNEG